MVMGRIILPSIITELLENLTNRVITLFSQLVDSLIQEKASYNKTLMELSLLTNTHFTS